MAKSNWAIVFGIGLWIACTTTTQTKATMDRLSLNKMESIQLQADKNSILNQLGRPDRISSFKELDNPRWSNQDLETWFYFDKIGQRFSLIFDSKLNILKSKSVILRTGESEISLDKAANKYDAKLTPVVVYNCIADHTSRDEYYVDSEKGLILLVAGPNKTVSGISWEIPNSRDIASDIRKEECPKGN